jgi:hypothetical protein
MVGPFGRSAIFALDGASPVVLAEGGRINVWTVHRIDAAAVEVVGPRGTRTLRPSFRTALVAQGAPPPSGQRIGLSLSR